MFFLHLFQLQGKFKTWLENRLITYTSWFDPALDWITAMNITMHSFSSRNKTNENTYPVLSTQAKQPDPSLLKNCTAAIINTHRLFFYTAWFAVSCDQKFLATYICYKTTRSYVKKTVSHHSETDCDKNWFSFNKNPTCYLLLKAPQNLSFHNANKYCSSINSSVVAVETIDYSPNLGNSQIIILRDYLLDVKYTHNILPPAHLMYNLDILMKIIFGMAVKADERQSDILNLLVHSRKWVHVAFPANLNKSCGVVEFSNIMKILMDNMDSHIHKGWGAKYTDCNDTIQTGVFICEKTSESYIRMCDIGYYECDDGTCILFIYLCDTFRDCLDGEDEIKCHPFMTQHHNLTTIEDNLYLPCPFFYHCKSRNTSWVMAVKIHTICDGVGSKMIILNEDVLCLHKNITYINHLGLISHRGRFYEKFLRRTGTHHIDVNVGKLLEQNFTLRIEKYYDEIIQNELDNSTALIDHYKFSCEQKGQFRSFYDMCLLRVHGKQCAYFYRDSVCGDISCPGMFKCERYYCIYMSSVCDGQVDCRFAEDEQYCSNTSCPGLLKCRGEVRCVGQNQICDGNVDCVLSFDDEISCNACPNNCKCYGYLLECTVLNSLQLIETFDKLYNKGIILNGLQQTIDLELLYTSSIVYIDINCGAEHIAFTPGSHSDHQSILFCDFSNNKLYKIDFLLSGILSKLVLLDLGNNDITLLSNKDIRLPYLMVLDVSNNPILEIMLDTSKYMESIKLIDLEYIKFHMNIVITKAKNKLLEIRVTDDNICCMLSELTLCTYKGVKKRCHGLMDSSRTAIMFICFALFTAAVFVIVTIRMSVKIYLGEDTRTFYNIVKMNHIVSELISTCSLVSLSAVGMTKIHLLGWRQSIVCHLINAMMSLSLGTTIIFKTFSLTIVAFRIIYPLRQQLHWLKKTALLSSSMWFSVMVMYGVSSTVAYFQNKNVFFDNLCSIGECHLKETGRLMIIFASSCNVVVIFFFICMVSNITVMLLSRNKSNPFQNNVSVPKVICTFSRQLIAQILWTVALIFISVSKAISSYHDDDYCYAVFIYALPISLTSGCILNMLM